MSRPDLPRAFGREAFGADPAAYDAVRPGYPSWVFDELAARGALGPGTVTFEIGAGTGIATRALLARGAGPLLAIEPDPRLAAFLRAHYPAVEVRRARLDRRHIPEHGAAFTAGAVVAPPPGRLTRRRTRAPGARSPRRSP